MKKWIGDFIVAIYFVACIVAWFILDSQWQQRYYYNSTSSYSDITKAWVLFLVYSFVALLPYFSFLRARKTLLNFGLLFVSIASWEISNLLLIAGMLPGFPPPSRTQERVLLFLSGGHVWTVKQLLEHHGLAGDYASLICTVAYMALSAGSLPLGKRRRERLSPLGKSD